MLSTDQGFRRRIPLLLCAWLTMLLLAIYAFDIGHGFLKDDFAWIASSQLRAVGDVGRLFTTPAPGFYRPLVALSFGLDERLFGLAPMGYALTNLALLFAILIGIVLLVEALGLTRVHGVCAAAGWALNFHGINLSLLWISGRTSLLLVLFAVFSALALTRRHYLLAGLLALAAMLSKEEATLLPFILAGWLLVDQRAGRGERSERVERAGQANGADRVVFDDDPDGSMLDPAAAADPRSERANAAHGPSTSVVDTRARVAAVVRGAWPTFLALAVYVLLRTRTGALTPATAQSFYQFGAAPGMLLANALEYADRSSTFTAAAVLCLLAMSRRWRRLNAGERQIATKGAIWLLGGFGLTIWLPVRSSLYACFPSIGSALIGVALASAIWRDLPVLWRRRAIATALLLPVLLLPVYRLRNVRLASEARLSARVMAFITDAIRHDPRITAIVLHDNPRERPSFWSSFGPLLPDAVALQTGKQLDVRLEGADTGEAGSPDAGQARSASAGRIASPDASQAGAGSEGARLPSPPALAPPAAVAPSAAPSPAEAPDAHVLQIALENGQPVRRP